MKRVLIIVAALFCLASPAFAQGIGINVVSSCATGVSPGYDVGSGSGRLTIDTKGNICGASSQLSSAQTSITGNAAGTTGAVVGTLAAAASKTTYICGFNVQAIGGTATVGPITVAGLVGSSQVYQTDVNSATVGKQVAGATFNPCIPASAVNTAITVTTTANGTATAVDVNSWGFQQ